MERKIESMSEKQIDLIVENDREWRKYILSELREIRHNQTKTAEVVTGLKVKVAFFGSVFGFATGLLGTIVAKYFHSPQ